MLVVKICATLLAFVSLTACQEHKPSPRCSETVSVTVRHGQKVYQTMDGRYLKADKVAVSACGSKPYSEDPWQHKFVTSIYQKYYWGEGHLMTYAEFREVGLKHDQVVTIDLFSMFYDDPPKHTPPPTWWYEPAIPHQRYPIDLLPNFGLRKPEPNAGIALVMSGPSVYWAVRGTKRPDTGMPFTTFCDIKPPRNRAANDVSYERDPKWLIQGETYSMETIGNTCRGGVTATNGKLGAMIDVPGSALPYIDKIYQAVALKLTEQTSE